jgi:hypothetical protein
MGLRPTRANDKHSRRHPRESGGPFSARNTMDSRLRGNDVIFAGLHSKRGLAASVFVRTRCPVSRLLLRIDFAFRATVE